MAKKDTLKNILVTGANGQLGTSLALMANSADANFFFTDVDTLDITDYRAVSAYMKKNRIDIVINCAAYTNVDKAEDDRDMAFKINAEAPGNLAKACRVNSAALIHISTDYVFEGDADRPYTEFGRGQAFSVRRLRREQAGRRRAGNR